MAYCDVTNARGHVRSVLSGSFSSADALAAAPGISYRQLDHWRAHGAVRPTVRHRNGSGQYSRWSPRDVARLQAIARMNSALRRVDLPGASLDLIGRVWAALEHDDTVTLGAPPVTITLTLEAVA